MPTHGSLTKAGKVRNQTPQIPAQERSGTIPRKNNKRRYQRMLKETQGYGRRRGRRRRRRRRR
jgi:small subunit ribosomal protein S30e